MTIMEHTSKITVRYYETDQMGVVHHSNYIRYFETAREEMMQPYGIPYSETESRGIIMPVHAVHCDYIGRPLRRSTFRVTDWIESARHASLSLTIYNLGPARKRLRHTGFVDVTRVR